MSKNIINQEPSGTSAGSSLTSAPDIVRLTQEVKFPLNISEGYDTDFKVRGLPVAPPGTVTEIKLTKISDVVHLTIPSFYGTLLIGNVTNTIRIITAGDIPARFLPKAPLSWSINGYNTASLVNSTQDFSDLRIDELGNVDLISLTYLWNQVSGLRYDVSVSWHVIG